MEKKGDDTFGRRAEETLHEVEKYGREKKHDIQELSLIHILISYLLGVKK